MRHHAQYFHYTIGSLLTNLSNDERQEIDILVLIANTVPQSHYAYNQLWISQLVDKIFEYNDTVTGYDHLLALEQSQDYWTKALLDYTTILEKCFGTDAPYILIVEDDVLAFHGWYTRTKDALRGLKSRQPSWYLRLFHTEEFLGWQSQRSPAYFTMSLEVTAVVVLLASFVRSLVPIIQNNFSRWIWLILLTVNCAAAILLIFAAGTQTIFPQQTGVIQMDDGCCGQSLVFPREIVPQLIEWFRIVEDGHADRRIEEFAEHAQLAPLALVPSAFQHIGTETSHEADLPEDVKYGMSLAQRVWNFRVEGGSCGEVLGPSHLAE